MKLVQSRFHFIGIGGIGMCGLAELLHNMGAKVSGSDLAENANTDRLKELGIKVIKGHKSENVIDVDVVVYSSAVHAQNPEMLAARGQKIPLIPRAEALAEIMRLKRGLAVAGTHGKTTTTSMTASIFLEAQAQPTIVVGGRFEMIKSTALLGKGDWLIAEADESDGSFAKLQPEIAIITNIDNDHMDYYKSFDNLQKAFLGFAQKVPFYGVSIVCGDDPAVRELFTGFTKRVAFYGFDKKNDYVLTGEKGRYEVSLNDAVIGDFEIHIPGKHNALNGLAAIAAGLQAGFSFETCRKGLAKFSGVDRRFHFKGEAGGVKIYDDYGHHPTEVRAALQGFREKYPSSRIVVYFQPHRYSRTQSCWHEFTLSFSQADKVLLGDIYAAGETAIDGISSEKLSGEIKHKEVLHLPKSQEMAKICVSQLKSGDVFVTLGAGDGWKLGLEVLEMLK
jgi:UDP-N-acetylmuramate--alanine ligase